MIFWRRKKKQQVEPKENKTDDLEKDLSEKQDGTIAKPGEEPVEVSTEISTSVPESEAMAPSVGPSLDETAIQHVEDDIHDDIHIDDPVLEAPAVSVDTRALDDMSASVAGGHMAEHVPESAHGQSTENFAVDESRADKTTAPESKIEEAQTEAETGLDDDAIVVAASTTASQGEEVVNQPKEGWFARLRKGLGKSSDKIGNGITAIFTKRKLDDETLEELEELLITADLGPATAARLTAELAKNRFGKDISPEEVRSELAEGMARILEPVAKPLTISLPDDTPKTPFVILVAGVNGSGKTTTIGKLGKQLVSQGFSVMLGAGDTFRAAAVEQLQVWGQRIGCKVVTKDIGSDAAALAYEAVEQAREEGVDILLLDTAGRLQNKSNLMEELQKVVRVLKKLDERAPHQVLLVLDATVGQNAHSQVEIFGNMINVTGLIVTKLDGSAKGGVIVSLAEKFGLPVHAIGVGEGVDDLRSFKAEDFARSLVGL